MIRRVFTRGTTFTAVILVLAVASPLVSVLAYAKPIGSLCTVEADDVLPNEYVDEPATEVGLLNCDGENDTSDAVKLVLNRFLQTYDAIGDSFSLADTQSTAKDVRGAFDLVVANPEYYWVAPRYTLSYYDANGNGRADSDEIVDSVKVRYVVDAAQVTQVKHDTGKVVEEALTWVDLEEMTEFNVVQALHDFLLWKCEYDYSSVLSDASYTPYGCLARGTAVCQGYSLAFKLLFNRVGIRCLYVVSKDMNHSWNLVQLDGSWYHVDATWDDSSSDPHLFFLRSDASFRDGLTPRHYGWTAAFQTQSCDYGNRAYEKFDGPLVRPKPGLADEVLTMYRLYNAYTGEHFYTASEVERDDLGRVGWIDEGIGWKSPKNSYKPVYRLYNPYVPGGDHHYTMGVAERDSLVAVGWRFEGVGWYSDDAERAVLYRQYNPNAMSGAHNYTVSKEENDALVAAGWRPEGVAWYGVSD